MIRQFVRQSAEVAVILALAAVVHRAWSTGALSARTTCLLVVALAAVKTVFFTVIFLRSDFISLEDALRGGGPLRRST